jgi:hypothetical protein
MTNLAQRSPAAKKEATSQATKRRNSKTGLDTNPIQTARAQAPFCFIARPLPPPLLVPEQELGGKEM